MVGFSELISGLDAFPVAIRGDCRRSRKTSRTHGTAAPEARDDLDQANKKLAAQAANKGMGPKTAVAAERTSCMPRSYPQET